MKQKYFSYVLLFRFYFHIDASTKGKQVISTKAFHDLARYFFVNNPVFRRHNSTQGKCANEAD